MNTIKEYDKLALGIYERYNGILNNPNWKWSRHPSKIPNISKYQFLGNLKNLYVAVSYVGND